MADAGICSQDVAAWVQAIGSIIAIGVAVWVSLHEGARTRKILANQEAAPTAALADLFEFWATMCERCRLAATDNDRDGIGRVHSDYNFVAETIGRFSWLSAKTERTLRVLTRYRELCSEFGNLAGPHVPPLTEAQRQTFATLIDEVRGHARTLRSEADRIRRGEI